MSEIVCPNCQSPQPAEAAFCDNCGFNLAGPAAQGVAQTATLAEPPPTPVLFAADRPDSPTGMQTCPACGAANFPEARFCDQCGSTLGVRTEPRKPTVPLAAPAASATLLETPSPASVDKTLPEGPRPAHISGWLAVEPTGARLDIPFGKTEIYVGREDPVSNIFPEIDLTPFGGEAAGVSRRHARFSLQEGELVLEDLDSTNFTFVNRKRVLPGTRQVVRNGDELRFGRITARYEGS